VEKEEKKEEEKEGDDEGLEEKKERQEPSLCIIFISFFFSNLQHIGIFSYPIFLD